MLHSQHKNGHCKSLASLLGRRKMLIFGVTFLGFSLTALVVQNIKPIYTASAQIIFDDAAFDNSGKNFIGMQKARLSSAKVAQAVILKLKLMGDDEFNDNGLKNQSRFKTINPYETKLPSLSNEIIAKDMEPIISRFRKSFSAQIMPSSSVIDLYYRAENPQKAAIILNEIIKNYFNSLTPENHVRDNEYETKILENLKANAKKAQENFNLLKESIGRLKPVNDTGSSTKIYEKAKAKYIRAKAQLKPLLDGNKSALNSLTSPYMRELRSEYNDLSQKLDAMSLDYGVKHPDIILLKSSLSNIDKQMLRERNNIISRIKSDYAQARADFEALKSPAVDNSAKYYDAFMRKKLKMLQNQADEMQRIFNEYNVIYNKYLNEEEEIKLSAQILSQVSVSSVPIFPNKPKILALGTFISFIIGLLLAIFIEKARNNFLSARQLEDYLDIPCYALIPKVKKDKDKPLSRYVIDNPSSTTSEAVRALKLVIKLSAQAAAREHKVITVTSSFPNEGKTTLSSWMAQLAAKSGQRVILIDADLRRPSIHKSFGRENKLSLVEYLTSQNKLEEVVDSNDPSGLHIIYGSSVPNNALDLISSDKMEQLISSLRKAYDLVIIDSPACMAVSDARALEKLSDHLLYAVSWNKTSRKTVHNGISQFTKFENALIATVLTNIDLKKHVQLGYGEAINYYGSYK